MKIRNIMTESFECVKINGILRNLNNDEMRIYKKVKENGKLFKADLEEFDQTIASSMVSKGLLGRKKSLTNDKHKGQLYFTTKGRKGMLGTKELDEVAPPDKDIEKWIKKNKKKFQDRYGDGYSKYLYGKAWKRYNGKKLNESVGYDIKGDRYYEKYTEYYDSTYIPLQWVDTNLNKQYRLYLYKNNNNFYVHSSPGIINAGKLVAGINTYDIEFGNTYIARPVNNNITDIHKPACLMRYDGGYNLTIMKFDGITFNGQIRAVLDALADKSMMLYAKDFSYKEEINNEPETSGEEFDECVKKYKKMLIETDLDDDERETLKDIMQFINEHSTERMSMTQLFGKFNDKFGINHDIFYNDTDMEDYRDTLLSNARESAQESGDYDVYIEGEVDADKTWDRIYDLDRETIIDCYSSSSDMNYYLELLLDECKDYLNSTYNVDYDEVNGDLSSLTTSSWDGSDESDINGQNQSDVPEITEDIAKLVETISYIVQLKNKTYLKYTDVFKANEQVEECDISLDVDEFFIDNLLRDAEMSAFNSGDYDVRDDGEFDWEATMDKILEEGEVYIIGTYASESDIEKFFDDILEHCQDVLDDDIPYDIANDELAGSEYDESYNPLNEEYVKQTKYDDTYGIEFNADYIRFEPGMRYMDGDGSIWTVIEVVDGDDDRIIGVVSDKGISLAISEDILNIRIIDDEPEYRIIYDEKYFNKEDLEGLDYIDDNDSAGSEYDE
jgi:hypothetical protein